jgi:hypothetical protein
VGARQRRPTSQPQRVYREIGASVLPNMMRVIVAHGRGEYRMHGAGPRAKISSMKPGRNDPCPGGSGKKYKQCCLERDVPQYTDGIPDVRDGLTREERVVLYVLHETQKERGDRNVPTAMLWGRVCEYFYISPDELSEMLARLGARR